MQQDNAKDKSQTVMCASKVFRSYISNQPWYTSEISLVWRCKLTFWRSSTIHRMMCLRDHYKCITWAFLQKPYTATVAIILPVSLFQSLLPVVVMGIVGNAAVVVYLCCCLCVCCCNCCFSWRHSKSGRWPGEWGSGRHSSARGRLPGHDAGRGEWGHRPTEVIPGEEQHHVWLKGGSSIFKSTFWHI